MSAAPHSAAVPRTFVIAVFVFAIAVGVLVAYFGITGQLGAGIP